jgi:hypothetical protein
MTNTTTDSPRDFKRVESLASISDKSISSFINNKVVEDKTELPPLPPPKESYHIFTPRQKWSLIFIISAAGLFSGLSSNIYFPAETQIAKVSQTPRTTQVIHTDDVVRIFVSA